MYVDDPLFSERELRALGYTPLTSEIEGTIRAIILQADHGAYHSLDFSRFADCQVVLDGRGALSHEKIESFGTRYIAIGDGNCEEAELPQDMQPPSSALYRRGGR